MHRTVNFIFQLYKMIIVMNFMFHYKVMIITQVLLTLPSKLLQKLNKLYNNYHQIKIELFISEKVLTI